MRAFSLKRTMFPYSTYKFFYSMHASSLAVIASRNHIMVVVVGYVCIDFVT